MPPKSHRRPQCQWTEEGRRCIRDVQSKESPFCRPHMIEAARAQQRAQTAAARAPSSSPLGNLINDFFAGKPFDPSTVGQALHDIGWNLGGIFGGQASYSPPIDHDPRGSPFHAGFYQQGGGRQQQQQYQEPPPQQPQVDPAAIQRARAELGFGPRDRLTEDVIKERRKQLARKFHPDLAGPDEKKRRHHTERMKTINEAADVLFGTIGTPP